MTLGENLQRLRKEKGLSQEDVAQKLFVSRQSVSKWENSAAEPGVENLKALAKLYGVTLDELMGEKPSEPPRQPQFIREEPQRTELDPFELIYGEQADSYYRWLIFFRIVMWGIMTFVTMGMSNTIKIPFDLIALLVGIWVTRPVMWDVILGLEGINAFFGLLGVVVTGSVYSPVNLVVSAVCLIAITRPSIKARFIREGA